MKRLAAIAAVLAAVSTVTSASAGSTRVPVLGPRCFPHVGCVTQNTKGFDQVRPSVIFFGGDGTGGICRVRWLTWGGRYAIGEGVAADVTVHQTDAQGEWNYAVVVASHLGISRGRPAYLRVGWTFPNGEVHPEAPGCAEF
jgi:hypothetical protein